MGSAGTVIQKIILFLLIITLRSCSNSWLISVFVGFWVWFFYPSLELHFKNLFIFLCNVSYCSNLELDAFRIIKWNCTSTRQLSTERSWVFSSKLIRYQLQIDFRILFLNLTLQTTQRSHFMYFFPFFSLGNHYISRTAFNAYYSTLFQSWTSCKRTNVFFL